MPLGTCWPKWLASDGPGFLITGEEGDMTAEWRGRHRCGRGMLLCLDPWKRSTKWDVFRSIKPSRPHPLLHELSLLQPRKIPQNQVVL